MGDNSSRWAIDAVALTKRFTIGRRWRSTALHTAVDGVSLQVEKGEVFGLLGPNGAGKTTLVKMLCTLIAPTAGEAHVLGYPLSAGEAIRRRVGLTVTDERSFYWRLSGRQNLRFFAALHGLYGQPAAARVEAVLAGVQLLEAADRPFSGYSSGMKQRLAIARALLAEPQLLFLDEPTRSLDPVATVRLHELILELCQTRQMTVFLITHDLAEAEKMCGRVAIMHQGQILAQERPLAIRRQLFQTRRYRLKVAGWTPPQPTESSRVAHFLGPDTIFSHEADHTLVIEGVVPTEDQTHQLDRLLAQIQAEGGKIILIESETPSLEEAFQKLVVPSNVSAG